MNVCDDLFQIRIYFETLKFKTQIRVYSKRKEYFVAENTTFNEPNDY